MSDYRDYLWTEDWAFFTSDGYCLALVGNSTPDDVLSKLSALNDRLTVTARTTHSPQATTSASATVSTEMAGNSPRSPTPATAGRS